MKTLLLYLFSLFALSFLVACSPTASDEVNDTTHILVVVGPSTHPPGSHEVAAGSRLIKYCLENMENVSGIEADVIHDWPEISQPLDRYASVVFIGDNFPGVRLPDSENVLEQLAGMMDRGCGIVCLHYGVGLRNEDVRPGGDHPLLHWMGGYFATRCDHHQSIAKIYEAATIEPADPDHPVSRGWSSFTLRDEPYINNYFGPDNNRMLPGAFAVATSMLPPDSPNREVIAWGIEREDTGRGIGITLPHFYKNWLNEDLRRFILNTLLWTAKREVPETGVLTTLPDLETFEPESVEFVPRKK